MSTTKRTLGDYTIQPLNGKVNIIGDLLVTGSSSIINSTNTQIEDNIITLNAGELGAGVTLTTAGLEVDRGSLDNVSIIWNETALTWQFTNDGINFYDFGSGTGGGAAAVDITGVSTGNPCVITTATPCGLSDGQLVTIVDTGVSALDGNSFYVNVLAGGITFELYSDSTLTTPVDGSGFSYTSGGQVNGGTGLTRVSQDLNPALGGNLNIYSRTIYSSAYNVVMQAGTPGKGGSGLFVGTGTAPATAELATSNKAITYGIIFS